MPCYRPLKGYRSRVCNPETGRRPIVFNARDGLSDMPVDLPCGQCIGCRLERSRQWAIRCMHESSLYEHNCFITLTYSDAYIPQDGSLQLKHYQDFMKRLRFRFSDQTIRFFHCGEYGEQFGRPHYHACLFNFDFPDKETHRLTPLGHTTWRSRTLEELWPWGLSEIGELTFESAAYVARYITKKVTGDLAEGHYLGKKPEYITMSRRPGIGKHWFDKFKTDVFPSDFIVLRGKKMRVPKAYDRYFELTYPQESFKNKLKRKTSGKMAMYHPDSWFMAPHRLSVKERCHELKFEQLKRSYESEA